MANDPDGIGHALRIPVDEASEIERARFLHAPPHERLEERTDDANGVQSKTVLTRLGGQTFDLPQARGDGFYPFSLENGLRTEQALRRARAEMDVQAVPTRKMCDIVVKLLGPEVSLSSTQIRRAAEQLDAGLAARCGICRLDKTSHLFLDARCERVREAGRPVDCALRAVASITRDGRHH